MDLHEHGISAYPEYVISALGAPSGMSQALPTSITSHNMVTAKPLPTSASGLVTVFGGGPTARLRTTKLLTSR